MYYGESATSQYVEESFLGDVGYFNKPFVDKKFADAMKIQDENARSKQVAKVMYDMIMNISAVCTKAVKLYDLYQLNYRYDNIIYTYCSKYSQYVNSKDKAKIKSAIDQSFVGTNSDKFIKFSIGIITNFIVPGEFKFLKKWVAKLSNEVGKNVAIKAIKAGADELTANQAGVEAAQKYFNMTFGALNMFARLIPVQELQKLFFFLCPVKFQTIGEALVTYKRASEPGALMFAHSASSAKYCFDITYAVLQDIMNVYKDL